MTFIPYYRRDSKKPKRDLFDKITLGVAIAGNIILAITAVIIGWQSYETRRAVNVSVNNLRPILIYEMTAAPVLSGNIPSTLHVHVEAQNVWQAPAVIRAVKIGYSVSPTFECSKLNRMTGKEEWPFDGKPTRFSFPKRWLLLPHENPLTIANDFAVNLTPSETSKLKEGRSNLWMYGVIYYDDYIPNEFKSDTEKRPYMFPFAQKYVFKQPLGNRPGFTYDGVPDNCIDG